MLTEKQLIKACQEYDKRSQFELVKRYSGMLMTVCRRYVTDQASAKDVLQESLILIFKHIGNYKPIGSFEAWMRKITTRCALEWLRRNAAKKETPILEMAVDEGELPEAYRRMDQEEIIALLRQLPDGFRAVFNLRVIEGYSHREIAEMLDIKESTSRSQLTRAKKILQHKLIAKRSKNLRAI